MTERSDNCWNCRYEPRNVPGARVSALCLSPKRSTDAFWGEIAGVNCWEPLPCDCGFETSNSLTAIQHIREQHPERMPSDKDLEAMIKGYHESKEKGGD